MTVVSREKCSCVSFFWPVSLSFPFVFVFAVADFVDFVRGKVTPFGGNAKTLLRGGVFCRELSSSRGRLAKRGVEGGEEFSSDVGGDDEGPAVSATWVPYVRLIREGMRQCIAMDCRSCEGCVAMSEDVVGSKEPE